MTKKWILVISLSGGSLAFAQANENNPSEVPSAQPTGPGDVRGSEGSEGRVDVQNQPKAAAEMPMGPIDINTVGILQLKTLPGIDDATAQRIVANRPYKTPGELVKKGVLSEKAFDSLRGRLVTKPMMK